LPSPGLRRFISIGTDVEDPRIAQLVGELSLASEPFRRLWARRDVRALAGAPTRMCRPQVGMLELRREKLLIGDSGGQLLVICHWRSRTPPVAGRSLRQTRRPLRAGCAREPRTSARGSFAP
jgi:hypothetical protein